MHGVRRCGSARAYSTSSAWSGRSPRVVPRLDGSAHRVQAQGRRPTQGPPSHSWEKFKEANIQARRASRAGKSEPRALGWNRKCTSSAHPHACMHGLQPRAATNTGIKWESNGQCLTEGAHRLGQQRSGGRALLGLRHGKPWQIQAALAARSVFRQARMLCRVPVGDRSGMLA